VERNQRIAGFTLLELLISIAISAIIAGAIYFSLNTALDSWEYTKDQLALQKVLNEVSEKIQAGTVTSFGLKDSLEVIAAGRRRMEFVAPWTDDTHTALDRGFVYTLNANVKPGTAVPIAEVKLFESDEYRFIPVELVREEETRRSRVRLGQVVPRGSQLRFTYHPDADRTPDAIKYIWHDEDDMAVYCERAGEVEEISENPFDVKITKMELRYYDRSNNLITESDWVDNRDLYLITGIELLMEARLGQYKKTLLSFVTLRNSPMRSGYLPISERLRIPIPDSYGIHTLQLKNIDGVTSEDILKIKAVPQRGKSWSIKIVFSKLGSDEAKIDRYVVEYPEGHEVFSEYPKSNVGTGLNLLTVGSNGRYDYDYDGEDVKDVVILEGDVILEVEKMEIEGCGIFVRP